MTLPTIGFVGEKLDLLIRQGADFGPVLAQMTNPDLSPVNLTGCTIRGQIRRKALDAVVVASFTCSITNPTDGRYQWGLSAAVTTAFVVGEQLTLSLSKFVYDLELLDAAGRITPLYYGDIQVLREVTR